MKHLRIKRVVLVLFIGALMSLLVWRAASVEAGIYDAANEVTYREYWVPHTEFTAGCGDHEEPNGSWYLEPYGCDKYVDLDIPDDFSQALKAEIYLDLWRNHDTPYARLSINGGKTIAPDVGSDWSRTPWVGEISMGELKRGVNTIKFWGGGYHVHDIAIRIYYDDSHPLRDKNGQPWSAPTGSLLTIEDDDGSVPTSVAADLQVENDQLKLVAYVGDGAKFVEFHGYYYGYDEDTDGHFLDWHNRGRNNWHPGGTEAKPLGGTIDHLGTIATPASGEYTATWQLPYVPDQSGVRFKIRIVDANGNVRDAAGGVSAPFKLTRTRPVVTFVDPGFRDAVLYHDGRYPETVTRTLTLPSDIGNYQRAYVLHSFWRTPTFSINGGASMYPNFRNSDSWQMAINTFNSSSLQPGENAFRYDYTSGFGQFIEKPGPMVAVKRKTAVSGDNVAPYTQSPSPAPDETNVDPHASVVVYVTDDNAGVDPGTIRMRVDGTTVTPRIAGTAKGYRLLYAPPASFDYNTAVTVAVDACDLQDNCMPTESYSFTTTNPPADATLESDDFNACALNTAVWSFSDPVGDATLNVNGTQLVLAVPAGKRHDVWASPNNNAPRVMQPTNNVDFVLEAKFDSELNQPYQFHGILVESNSSNLLRFNFTYDGTDTRAQAYSFSSGTPSSKGDTIIPAGAPMYMRVDRKGNTWKLFHSTDGVSWTKTAQFTRSLTVRKVGVFVGNANPSGPIPAYTGVIDYFFDVAEPIAPEDAQALVLPLSVEGNGQVSEEPTCGNPVTLTAVPDPGWSFAGWSSLSGTISSTENPFTTAFGPDEEVMATFTRDEYTLAVDVVNDGVGEGGAVSVTPQQDVYFYGDEVTLDVTTNPGWQFSGWGGALSGTETTKSVTMMQDTAVSATFTQEQYALDTATEGEGTVQASPAKPYYVYGDQVTLTAVPARGWQFTGWTGDVPAANANPVQITFSGDRAVTATFARVPYTLDVAVVSNGSGQGGAVSITPQQETYFYGDEVTLQAVPQPGWAFVGWSGGGLSGSQMTKTLTITGNMTIEAIFAQKVTLTVEVNGSGTVQLNGPDRGYYQYGDRITLTAVPDSADIYFGGWSGDLQGAVNPAVITLQKDTRITALFTTSRPPTVAPLPDREVNVYEEIVVTVQATDPDGDTLSFSLAADPTLPTGVRFTDNGDGTATFRWRPSHNQTGNYTFTFTASDGIVVGSATMRVTVRGQALFLPLIQR